MIINNYYNLPDLEKHEDGYSIYASDLDMDEVIKNLCWPGTTWTVVGDAKTTFPSSAINRNLKLWHHFVAAHLIHMSHLTEVTKDWALLLFAIHSGQAMDVGRIVCQTILYETCHQNICLSFPSLITDLCAWAKVKWSNGNEIIHPIQTLNKNTIFQIKDCEDKTLGSNSSRPQQPVPRCQLTVTERLDLLESERYRAREWISPPIWLVLRPISNGRFVMLPIS